MASWIEMFKPTYWFEFNNGYDFCFTTVREQSLP